MKRSLAVLLAIFLLGGVLQFLSGAGYSQNPGSSQNERYFRVEAQRGTTRAGRPILYGWVYNDYGLRAIDVRLLAEAIEASGRVADRTAGYVTGDISPFSRSYFEMPAPSGGVTHRVTVSSFFFRQGGGGS